MANIDPMSYLNDPSLNNAANAARDAGQNAVYAQEAGSTLGDRLKTALTQKFSSNNPQVATRERALQNYMTETTNGPQTLLPGQGGPVYSPTQQAAILGARRSAALAPLTTANYLLGLQTGGIGDVIDAVSRAWQGEQNRYQGLANVENQSYQNQLDLAKTKASLASSLMGTNDIVEANGHKYLINKQTGDIVKDLGTSGSGSGSTGISSLLNSLMSGSTNGVTPTEPKPTVIPVNSGNRIYHSEGGQWVYDPSTMNWVPVVP